MVLTAARGAVGFLTRLPLGRSERAWAALGETPAVMVPTAYVIGALAATPVLVLPGASAALAYPLALVALTGIAHADGLADLADAAVVHGTPAERRSVMRDTVTGVGGTVALGLDFVGLALAGLALAAAPLPVALGLVVAAEVGAKLAMVALAVQGGEAHPGMGAHLAGAGPLQLAAGAVLAVPAAFLAWPALAPAVAPVAALAGGVLVAAWARRRIGGISGDVFGATNEVARLLALHAGVVVWMRF